jgi:hypothetical protein
MSMASANGLSAQLGCVAWVVKLNVPRAWVLPFDDVPVLKRTTPVFSFTPILNATREENPSGAGNKAEERGKGNYSSLLAVTPSA